MAICNIDKCRILDCQDLRRVGGVRSLWLFNIESDAGRVLTTETAEGVVTDLTLPTYTGLYRIEGPDNAHSAGYEIQIAEGGNTFFNHSVLVKTFLMIDAVGIELLNDMVVAKLGAVVENANQQFHLYYPSNGLKVSEGTQNTGQADNSDTTDTLTFQGGDINAPKLFEDTDYATTLAKIQGYEICT